MEKKELKYVDGARKNIESILSSIKEIKKGNRLTFHYGVHKDGTRDEYFDFHEKIQLSTEIIQKELQKIFILVKDPKNKKYL